MFCLVNKKIIIQALQHEQIRPPRVTLNYTVSQKSSHLSTFCNFVKS